MFVSIIIKLIINLISR